MPQSSNLALICENYADRGTLTGGGWQTGSLKIANLLTPYFAEVARSNSVNPADTQFRVDLGATFAIGGIAIGPCSVTPFAEARVRAYLDAAGTIPFYDSGRLPFPGTIVDSTQLEWEDDGFWDGVTREFDDIAKGALFIHLPENPVPARIWLIEIFDANNPAGHIDIGRLIMGKRWQPAYNYTYDGNSLDFEALTDVEESRSGARFYNPRNNRRSFSFSFAYLPDADTFRDVYRIATRSGQHNQLVVVPSPDDADSYQREAFIGTLGPLPSLRRPVFGQAATAFKIEETL